MGRAEELGLVKNIFIINKQGCKRAEEAVEILMDRRTQASWRPAPTLMASVSASGKTSWAHVALWEPLPGLMLGALPPCGVCGCSL